MKLGDKDYKLLLLDTNVIRETVLNTNSVGKGLLTRFFVDHDDYAPCFSVFSVFELYPYQDIYNRFLDFFDVMPSIMFFPCRNIFQQEFSDYLNNRTMQIIGQIAWVSSPFFKDKKLMLRALLNNTWDNKSFVETLKTEIDDFSEVVIDWEIQRKRSRTNIKLPPIVHYSNKYYKSKEKEAVKKDLINWGIDITMKTDVDIEKLPAARMMEYSQFRKVYIASRKLTKNDVMDVAISCIAPYVDAIITEASQADIYKQSKNIIPQMKDVEIFTLRDIKEQDGVSQ